MSDVLETITTFEWVPSNDGWTPLPVDVNDVDALREALAWATGEMVRATVPAWATGEMYDALAYDYRAIRAFCEALQVRIGALTKRDTTALDAWNSGAPIPGGTYHLPPPGSDAALALGCRCPVLDRPGDGLAWMSGDCPLHGGGR